MGAGKENYYRRASVFLARRGRAEYSVYDFDNYRYHIGSDMEVGNFYPVGYAQTFYEGMQAEGQSNIINLLRCAWAGSQRYGALVWSGDIDCTFDASAAAGRGAQHGDRRAFRGGRPTSVASRVAIPMTPLTASCSSGGSSGGRFARVPAPWAPDPQGTPRGPSRTFCFPAARTRCGAMVKRHPGYLKSTCACANGFDRTSLAS